MALYKVVFTKMYYTSPSPSFGNMAILLRPPRSFKLFPRPLADLQKAGRRANRMHISVNDHWPRCKEDDSSIILLPFEGFLSERRDPTEFNDVTRGVIDPPNRT